MKTPNVKNMLEYEKAEAQAKKDIKREFGIVLNNTHIPVVVNPIIILAHRTLV
jgi:hypothetical protein